MKYNVNQVYVDVIKVDLLDNSDESGFKVFGKQAMYDFFKELVKHGIEDARYYELIYIMLTYRFNDNFSLGFTMSRYNGFNV